jgi:hypothetical protein
MDSKAKRAPRRRRFSRAWITVDGCLDNRECKILDLSERGAKLLLDPTTQVPTNFLITRVPKAMKEECHVIWQRGRTVGIKFIR